MATKSVYVPDPIFDEDLLIVSGYEHHHLKVSRTHSNETVDVFDGKGHVWVGEVVSVERQKTRIRVINARNEPKPSIELILAQGLIKPTYFDWILEKAVEVGVTRIIPFQADRSNEGGWKVERWHRIIVQAAKQSKHYYLPTLNEVTSFAETLQVSAQSKILFAEKDGNSLKSILCRAPVLYFIGPEGGWTQRELQNAESHGAKLVRLGAHIMRAETAAIVAAGLIQYELGEF